MSETILRFGPYNRKQILDRIADSAKRRVTLGVDWKRAYNSDVQFLLAVLGEVVREVRWRYHIYTIKNTEAINALLRETLSNSAPGNSAKAVNLLDILRNLEAQMIPNAPDANAEPNRKANKKRGRK